MVEVLLPYLFDAALSGRCLLLFSGEYKSIRNALGRVLELHRDARPSRTRQKEKAGHDNNCCLLLSLNASLFLSTLDSLACVLRCIDSSRHGLRYSVLTTLCTYNILVRRLDTCVASGVDESMGIRSRLYPPRTAARLGTVEQTVSCSTESTVGTYSPDTMLK